MPMVDYLCDSCSYRFENYFHSDPPETQPCPHIECSTGISRRIYSLPGEYRPVNARRFSPIVVWVNNENPDQISVPGRSDEPVQEGYHAVEITDMRTADHYTRHMNNVALRDAINQRAAEREFFDARTKERRDATLARIGNNPRMRAMFEKACEYVDRKRDAKYSKPLDPRGHFQVLSFNSSNRQSYSDAETGWRERKA